MASSVEQYRTVTTSEAVDWRKCGTFSSTRNTAGYTGVGGRVDGVFERTVASGDNVVLRLWNAGGTFVVTVASSCSVGDRLYTAASGKLSTTQNGPAVAIALEAATTDGDQIEVEPVKSDVGGSAMVYNAVAASSVIAGVSTETAYDVSYTFSANALEAGDCLDIWAQGIITGANSTDTHTFKLKIGSSAICTTGAPDSVANDIFILHARVTIRTAGTSGTLVASGLTFNGTPGAAAGAADIPSGHFIASTTINTQATQAVTVTSTVSAADANNNSRLDMLTIIKHRK